MLSGGEKDFLTAALHLDRLINEVQQANIDEGLRVEFGRAFTEAGGQLISSPWAPSDAAGDVIDMAAVRADRRAELAGDL